MKTTQYTIRNLPIQLDARLRSLATRQKLSLNAVVVQQLERSLELTASSPKTNKDFDHLLGKMQPDSEFDKRLHEQRQIDSADWV